jgi:hypothetical protein
MLGELGSNKNDFTRCCDFVYSTLPVFSKLAAAAFAPGASLCYTLYTLWAAQAVLLLCSIL